MRYRRRGSGTSILVQPGTTIIFSDPDNGPELESYECDRCHWRGNSAICAKCGDFCDRGTYLCFTQELKAEIAQWLTELLAGCGRLPLRLLVLEAEQARYPMVVVYGLAHLLEFAQEGDVFELPGDHPLA
jgi:hypothetical protein